MEILGAPSGLATFPSRRPHCRYFAREPRACFFLCSRFLSAPSLLSPFRVQIQFHPWSKQLFPIIPKAQSAPDEFPDESNDDVSSADRFQREARRKKALERLDEQLLEGVKPPYVEYLMGLGLDLDDIRKIAGRYPFIRHCSVDGEIRPFVEVLRNIGVDHKGLLVILHRCPHAMAENIAKTFLPTMAYLESLDMDKEQCIKAIFRFPQLITLNEETIEDKVTYFLELGLTVENVRKMILHAPQLLGMSVEKKLKPTMEFFLTKGFTKEIVQTMVVKFPNIYGYSLTKSLVPKWEFFLEMGYPTSHLANFPQYFGYSLEGRIKPRHKLAMEHGVRLYFISLLSSTDTKFEMLLEKLVSRRSLKDDGECST